MPRRSCRPAAAASSCTAPTSSAHADGRSRGAAPTTPTRPPGAGYAVLNRTVLTRLFPDTYRDLGVRRLADFFTALRAGLSAAGAAATARTRASWCSRRASVTRSYFEHSYLATLPRLQPGRGRRPGRARRPRVAPGARRPGARRRAAAPRRGRRRRPARARARRAGGVPGLVEAAREHGVGRRQRPRRRPSPATSACSRTSRRCASASSASACALAVAPHALVRRSRSAGESC